VTPPTAPAVELNKLTKRFGALTAVDTLSFRVERGEIFGLLGPNGSGKTTTINVVSGLTRPSSGEVRVLGYDVTRDLRAVRAALGAVPQETALYEELSARHNMVFHAELYDVPRSERDRRIDELLDLVQLADRQHSRVGTFSGGMKRRLALARALLHEPLLLYLDEPTLGVDVQSRRALWDYILDLKTKGKTVLITTNYLEEANVLCDRLAILDHGKLIALDTPANLKRRFGATVIQIETTPAASPVAIERIRAVAGVAEVQQVAGTLTIIVNGEHSPAGSIIMLLTQEAEILAISQREPDLDEIFLRLTGNSLRD